LVKQQVSALGTRTTIPNTPGLFPKLTEATSTLEQEDGIIHYHSRPNSAITIKTSFKCPTDTKHISSSARPTISHQVQDPQTHKG